ncbi:MAG TPA: phosphoribosylglycinamide formyltransferase [Candidatus Bathyarchaeota archaeon]|nr:phosphoribosylglycinamide formyltransferase [Candidatus Bathyarchaeota archaeon]
MQAIIDEIEKGKLNAELVCVVSDRRDAYALKRARKHGIEAIYLNPKGLSKEEYDRRLIQILDERDVDLVLLIGYKRFLTKLFIDRFRNRIMNIHPSLLPAFPGWDLDVHKSVLDYGVKITGCTLHFVDENIDAGPIILQKAVPVYDDDTPESLKERVQKAEQEIILEGIRLFMKGKLRVVGRKVYTS